MELEDFQEEEEESSGESVMDENFEGESEPSQSHSGNFYIFYFLYIYF